MQIWHPYTQHALFERLPVIERAHGAYLYETGGRALFDAISSWWVITHAHTHPAIVEAIRAQALRCDQVIFAAQSHEAAEKFVADLTGFMENAFSHIFFSESGSVAVEVAVKMALGYFYNAGKPRKRIMTLANAYHGDTIGSMSMSAPSVFNEAYRDVLFEVERLPFPQGDADATLTRLLEACRQCKPAALLVEPLLCGAGGMKTYQVATLDAMTKICREHDVPVIFDEILTGWGRTGTAFAYQQCHYVPDIVCMAKGLTGGTVPLAATLCAPHIYAGFFARDRRKTFYHSGSFTANPLAVAAASANVGIWRAGGVEERIKAMAAHQEKCLQHVSTLSCVRNARRCGMIAAFDLDVDDPGYLADVGQALYRHFTAAGQLLRPLGNCVYVMPPYCTRKEELDICYGVIEEGLRAVVGSA